MNNEWKEIFSPYTHIWRYNLTNRNYLISKDLNAEDGRLTIYLLDDECGESVLSNSRLKLVELCHQNFLQILNE